LSLVGQSANSKLGIAVPQFMSGRYNKARHLGQMSVRNITS
jgi:hypothetical protein